MLRILRETIVKHYISYGGMRNDEKIHIRVCGKYKKGWERTGRKMYCCKQGGKNNQKKGQNFKN